MKRGNHIPSSILLVTAFYLVAALSTAVTQKDWGFLSFRIPFFIFLSVLVSFTHKQAGFPRGLLWALSLLGMMHLAGRLVNLPQDWSYQGTQPLLSSWWLIQERLKYDNIVHAYGFGLSTWICWEVLRANIHHRFGRKLYPSFGPIALSALAGMGLGAMNVLIDFFAVIQISDTHLGGYFNLGWDLVANLIGCLIASVIIAARG